MKPPSPQLVQWLWIALGALALALLVAVQARRRGYSLVVWLVAGVLGQPLFLLVLLGVLPDLRRRRLRQAEREDLERRLGRAGRTREAPGLPRAPERSLGDEETRL